MPAKKRRTVGPTHRFQKGVKTHVRRNSMQTMLHLYKEVPVYMPQPSKELPSIGLSCTCFGKMHPDPQCPLHCGDLIR